MMNDNEDLYPKVRELHTEILLDSARTVRRLLETIERKAARDEISDKALPELLRECRYCAKEMADTLAPKDTIANNVPFDNDRDLFAPDGPFYELRDIGERGARLYGG